MHDRRTFLKLIAAAAAAGPAARGLAQGAATPSAIRKSILISMLPKDLSYAARFAMAREAGFDAIEMQTIARPEEAAEILAAARTAGLRIHSVMNMDHWRLPLSSSCTASRLNSGLNRFRWPIRHLRGTCCPHFKVSVKPGPPQVLQSHIG